MNFEELTNYHGDCAYFDRECQWCNKHEKGVLNFNPGCDDFNPNNGR